MQNEFQDCNSENWSVTLSSTAQKFAVESMSRGVEEITTAIQAERKDSRILLSDGKIANLCKVGDDWWVHYSADACWILTKGLGHESFSLLRSSCGVTRRR